MYRMDQGEVPQRLRCQLSRTTSTTCAPRGGTTTRAARGPPTVSEAIGGTGWLPVMVARSAQESRLGGRTAKTAIFYRSPVPRRSISTGDMHRNDKDGPGLPPDLVLLGTSRSRAGRS